MGRKEKSLLTLTYRKSHQGSNPSGHNFVFRNVSINKKPFSLSQVVIYKETLREPPTGHAPSFEDWLADGLLAIQNRMIQSLVFSLSWAL
jgi:hypothetical protein